MIKGVDVSKYQGRINWTKAKADGVQFAILKAINKQNKTEESFERNYAECVANSIPVGVYNYSYATSIQKAEEDAMSLLSTIAEKKIKMRVWLDVEDGCQKVLGRLLIDIIKAYQKIIESAGFDFGVYTGLRFYNSYIKPYDTLKCPFWIARYPSNEIMRLKDSPDQSKKPNIGKDIFAWQYTSKGTIDGIDSKCDINILYSDAEEIPKTSLTGKGLAEYAISKLGTPYFYGMKMETLTESKMMTMHRLYPSTVTESYMQTARIKGIVGKTCVDCSGLIGAYRRKQIGSSQLYSTASKRLNMANLEAFPIGSVLWKKGHVGVYIGNGYCVEAKGVNYGTIKSKIMDTKWSCGLLFDDLSYNYDNFIEYDTRKENPYQKPVKTLKYGAKGNDVKWLQFELNESGFNLVIDGEFGAKTKQAVIDFQSSCKILVDGIVGTQTITKLIEM